MDREPVQQPPGSCPAQPRSTLTRMVLALRREGPLTADTLAERIGLSRTAVLHRLEDLRATGFVSRRSVRHGIGRPRHFYDVTSQAQALLPAGYESLAASLLEATHRIGGHELVARIVEARRRVQVDAIRARFAAQGLDTAPLVVRAREVAAIHDEMGFECDVRDEAGLRIIAHNCPVLQIATESPEVCDAESRLLAEVLAAEVVRESHIATGDRHCRYRIYAKGWDLAQMRPAARTPQSPRDSRAG